MPVMAQYPLKTGECSAGDSLYLALNPSIAIGI